VENASSVRRSLVLVEVQDGFEVSLGMRRSPPNSAVTLSSHRAMFRLGKSIVAVQTSLRNIG
jgi:hypothetical protein